jgi:hypothetical protein
MYALRSGGNRAPSALLLVSLLASPGQEPAPAVAEHHIVEVMATTDEVGFEPPPMTAAGPDGRVYVADRVRGRIDVYSPELAFVGAIGGPGRADGRFASLGALAAGDDGSVWVADEIFEPGPEECGTGITNCPTTRVQRFGLDGRFLGRQPSPALPMAVGPDGTRYFLHIDGIARVAADGTVLATLELAGDLARVTDSTITADSHVVVAVDQPPSIVSFDPDNTHGTSFAVGCGTSRPVRATVRIDAVPGQSVVRGVIFEPEGHRCALEFDARGGQPPEIRSAPVPFAPSTPGGHVRFDVLRAERFLWAGSVTHDDGTRRSVMVTDSDFEMVASLPVKSATPRWGHIDGSAHGWLLLDEPAELSFEEPAAAASLSIFRPDGNFIATVTVTSGTDDLRRPIVATALAPSGVPWVLWANGDLSRLAPDPTDFPEVDPYGTDFDIAADGTIWLVGWNGILHLDAQGGELASWPLATTVDEAKRVAIGPDGRVYVLTREDDRPWIRAYDSSGRPLDDVDLLSVGRALGFSAVEASDVAVGPGPIIYVAALDWDSALGEDSSGWPQGYIIALDESGQPLQRFRSPSGAGAMPFGVQSIATGPNGDLAAMRYASGAPGAFDVFRASADSWTIGTWPSPQRLGYPRLMTVVDDGPEPTLRWLPEPSAAPDDGDFDARVTRSLMGDGGLYRVDVTSPGGIRLWVGHDLLIDRWAADSVTESAVVRVPREPTLLALELAQRSPTEAGAQLIVTVARVTGRATAFLPLCRR